MGIFFSLNSVGPKDHLEPQMGLLFKMSRFDPGYLTGLMVEIIILFGTAVRSAGFFWLYFYTPNQPELERFSPSLIVGLFNVL